MAKINVVQIVNQISFVKNVSQDEQASTVLFENLNVSLGGIVKDRLLDLKSITVEIRFKEQDAPLDVNVDVRGLADIKTAGVAYSVVLQTSNLFYPLTLPEQIGESKDYAQRFSLQVPAGKPLFLTLHLRIERENDAVETGGLLTVESLDIEIQPAQVCSAKS